MYDLIVLVADRNMRFAVAGILDCPKKLKIRPVQTPPPYVHPGHDAGIIGKCHIFLRPLQKEAQFAMVICDRAGCGREEKQRQQLEVDIEGRLAANGWGNRSAVVVIDPELETWVWSDSPHVPAALGWKENRAELQAWLEEKGYQEPGQLKPSKPKEAVEELLRVAGRPRSSSWYNRLAHEVTFQRCSDPAFAKLTRTLRRWFPE